MSPRAACRLETLGFNHVYDYVPGKSDWLARGLPTEGESAGRKRAHHFASSDVAIVGHDETLDDTAGRIDATSFPFALVASHDGTILGRLPRSLTQQTKRRAEEVMRPGPSTTRADTDAGTLLERLDRNNLSYAIITTPEGHLIGIVRRSDLQKSTES